MAFGRCLTPKALDVSNVRLWILTFVYGQNVAGLRFLFKMKLETPYLEFTQHQLDALSDKRMVGAVAGDKFLDDGPQCRGRQLAMRDAHEISLLRKAKSIITSRPL
jgi:hypothetical protein